MSFVTQESIVRLIEEMLHYCWPADEPDLPDTLPRMTYSEAMNNYGTDKPDTRLEWKVNKQ